MKPGAKHNFVQYIKGKNFNYERLQDIGNGGYGAIAKYKAAHPDFKGLHKNFAVKFIEDKKSSKIEKEIFVKIEQKPHKNLINLE